LTAAYKANTFPQKINLGVGAYRDNDNKPWVLPVIKRVRLLRLYLSILRLNSIAPPQATRILLNDPTIDHEYLPITGLPEFTAGAAKLILGTGSPAIEEGRAVSVQTISGTGANHLGALFLSRFYHWDGPKQVYLSNPTWGKFT
jgi:aspartate aminotransferase